MLSMVEGGASIAGKYGSDVALLAVAFWPPEAMTSESGRALGARLLGDFTRKNAS